MKPWEVWLLWWSPSGHPGPNEKLGEYATRREAEARAKQARKNYLPPHQVEVR